TRRSSDLFVRWITVENPKTEAVVAAVVHRTEHAERPIVDFVQGQVAAEVSQRLVQVVERQSSPTLFPPRPRPSSGWWHRERRHGGPARGARRQTGRAIHPRPPGGRPCS